MKTFREIIDAFGISPLASALGVDESHMRVMRTRDSIPPKYWRALLECERPEALHGLTLAILDDLYEARFPKSVDPTSQIEAASQ